MHRVDSPAPAVVPAGQLEGVSIPPQVADLVTRHLRENPRDARYLSLLLKNEECAPGDRKYRTWLNYNLGGIDGGFRLIERLEGRMGPIAGRSVLDIGAGGGGASIAFARHGCFVTAMEIDPVRIRWLRTRVQDHEVPIRIIDAPVESLAADERFDIVICRSVLEHVDQWREFLLSLLEHCQGAIYLSWPNKFSILEIMADGHYGLPGASFLTGRLRSLQEPYIRLFGIQRNAWVTEIPLRGAVRRLVRSRGFDLEALPPQNFEKLADPARINHPLARKVLNILRHLGIGRDAMLKLVMAQNITIETLVVNRNARLPGGGR